MFVTLTAKRILMFSHLSLSIRILLRLTLATAIAPALASADDRVLEEVAVTAQKISESVQNVPVSLALVTAENLSQINAFDFLETQSLTPGVAVFPGLQAAAIRIRGVGPGFFALGAPQSVAIYVDGVAQSQAGAVLSTLVDVEQLELLRGPQGTLYGLNAPGGVYNIRTRAPDFDSIGGFLEGSYGQFDSSDMASTNVRGAINLPLVEERLALRLAAVYTESDGFVEMANPLAREEVTGGREHKAIRGKLLWQVSEDMTFLLSSNYKDMSDYEAGFSYDGLVPGTGEGTDLSPIVNRFDDNQNFAERRSVVNGELEDISLSWNWQTQGPSLDAIVFSQTFKTDSDLHRDAFPGNQDLFLLGVDFEISTLELRASEVGDVFDYVVGAYYYEQDADSSINIALQGVLVTGGAQSEGSGYSVFGNFNFHLTPQWDLALGLRYDDQKTDYLSSTAFLAFQADIDDALEFDDVSWSLKLRHYINDDLTAYLAVDRAHKQGGFNTLVAGVLPLGTTFPEKASVAESVLSYDPEKTTAFEVGVKGTALERQLRYSIAVFYQVFQDHQVQQPDSVVALEPIAGLFNSALANAEEVTTAGVELEVTYLFAQHWDAVVRLAYSDPRVEEWSNHFCAAGEEQNSDQIFCPKGNGDPLNDIPRWNSNAQLGYEKPLEQGWDVYGRVAWTWRSAPAETSVTNNYSQSVNDIGLTVGARDESLGLDVRAWVKNLTDEDSNVSPGGDPNLSSSGEPLFFRGSFFPGLEYGLTVLYSF